MEKMTIAEFNSIPTFFIKGREKMEIDGQVYDKIALRNLLTAIGYLD